MWGVSGGQWGSVGLAQQPCLAVVAVVAVVADDDDEEEKEEEG